MIPKWKSCARIATTAPIMAASGRALAQHNGKGSADVLISTLTFRGPRTQPFSFNNSTFVSSESGKIWLKLDEPPSGPNEAIQFNKVFKSAPEFSGKSGQNFTNRRTN